MKKICYFKKIFKDFDSKYKRNKWIKLCICGIAITLPPTKWYRAAYQMSVWVAIVKKHFTSCNMLARVLQYNSQQGNNKVNQAIGFIVADRLNTYLSLFTRLKVPYPISFHCNQNPTDQVINRGVVLVSVHLPLVKAAVGHLLQKGFNIDAAIAGNPTKGGKMAFWGTTLTVNTILADSYSLVKAKTILSNNGCIALMVDYGEELIISPNVFHLAAKTNAQVLFLIPYLNAQGIVEIYLSTPPYNICTKTEHIEANIADLKNKREVVFKKYLTQHF